MKLEITSEKVLEASKNCPQAEQTLKTLFPEVFKKKDKSVTIKPFKLDHKLLENPIAIGLGLVSKELADKSFVLSYEYDWELKSIYGLNVLIPTLKD